MARDALTVALAMQCRNRNGVTLNGICLVCLPPGTPWPCLPFWLAQRTIERLATPSPPAHPDWLDGRR